MANCIPLKQMTVQEIQAEIDQEFWQWNDIACNGCQDPTWSDGVNMNLIRKRIIFMYRLLDERNNSDIQMSIFDSRTEGPPRRPVPPKVPNQYMVAGCKYSDRLKDRYSQALVWGTRGEHRA